MSRVQRPLQLAAQPQLAQLPQPAAAPHACSLKASAAASAALRITNAASFISAGPLLLPPSQ
jgi:hypothetical protein